MRSEQGKETTKRKTVSYSFLFLVIVLIVYGVLFFLEPNKSMRSVYASWHIFLNIIPVLLVVIFLMGLSNYVLKPKKVSVYLGKKSGFKGWLLSALFGILSHGPIYVWYPLLKDLKEQGMRTGLVAVFLYNRAIKIPLLPVMIFYFGVLFVLILCVYMIVFSLLQGKIIEILEDTQRESKREQV